MYSKEMVDRSPVHVVLVSLLVNQLSILFLIFFWSTKKNCPVSGNFWSVSGNFWLTKFLFGIPKLFLVDQIFFGLPKIPRDWPKIPWNWTIFFLVDQKNEKKTGQLVYQETDQNHMDGTKFVRSFFGRNRLFTKRSICLFFLVPSMWFWSVSWSTNCSVFFSFFLVDQKKIVQSQGIFGQSLGIFGTPKRNLVDQKKFWYTKKKFGRPKIPRDWPKIPWDWTIFFWSTKKNEKKTGQLVDQETDQNHMDGTKEAGLSKIL